MKQEFFLIIIVGLIIIAYVLDAVVNPLPVKLATPYEYFLSGIATTYIFTSASIVLKAIALFITPLWLLSFIGITRLIKGAILIALSGLIQLYSLQDIATQARVIPVEWALSFTLAGVALLIPAVIYILMGILGKAHNSMFPKEEPYMVTDPDYKPQES